jgi:hypothetical protein
LETRWLSKLIWIHLRWSTAPKHISAEGLFTNVNHRIVHILIPNFQKTSNLGVSTPTSCMGNKKYFSISPHFYPVILHSFPYKIYYYFY